MTDTKNIVQLRAGDETYGLAFTTEAQIAYEDEMSCDFSSVLTFFMKAGTQKHAEGSLPQLLSVRTTRALLWAALNGGGTKVSMKQAGEIMDRAGYVAAFTALLHAVSQAFGVGEGDADTTKGKGEAAAKSTPKRKATTGAKPPEASASAS
nr:hypothetical protein [uncultured Celeribacter sp.]